MRKLFIIPMLLAVLSTGAQTAGIDSLRKVLPSLKDTSRVDCLNYLAFRYLDGMDRDTAGLYAEKGLQEARSLHYVHGIALALAAKTGITLRCGYSYVQEEAMAREALRWFDRTPNKGGIEATYYMLGFALFGQSRFDESMKYLQKAFACSSRVNDKEDMLASMSLISEARRERGEYDSSYDIGLRCLQMASDLHNKEWEARQLFILGNLSTHIEDYGAALSYFHRGFAAYQPHKIDPWIITEYAELLSLLGKYDSANYYYRQVDTTNSGPGLMRVYLVSTGEYYLLQKDYDHALVNFQRSLPYNWQLEDGNQVMRNLLDIGRAYIDFGREAAALPYVREALSMATRVRAVQNIRDGYRLLSSIYDKRGQTDSAYFYYRRYISMKDSVVNDQVKGKFASYAFAQQISLLNKDKQIEDACLHTEMLVKNILLGGIVVLLLIGFIFSRIVLLKKKNEAHLRKRAENELEIERLEGERAKVTLLERAKALEIQALRSQMNPHFIFNCLNAINRFVLGHETEAASDYLTKFSRLMRMIMNHSRHSVIPLADELEVLSLYLDMESLRFKNAFDYHIRVEDDIEAGDIYIPPLLLQPFVENAVWHGLMHKQGRGELFVDVQERGGVLTVTIRDNGIGRRRAGILKSKSVEKYKSMGLQITAQRLALLTGEGKPGHLFEIEDLYDQDGNATGTQVVLKIRIHRHSGEPA